MRMVPSTVHECKSNAERKVFSLLAASDFGANATAIHSLNLPRHEYKRWGELDFVLVCEDGVFALEVKGGRVSCRDGFWQYTDRFGTEHSNDEGPFNQARSGHFALKERLERLISPQALNGLTFGWGVVFPDCEFDIRGVEFDPAIVLSSSNVRSQSDLLFALKRLASFWRSKESAPKHLDPARIKLIVDACRPSFDVVPLLGQRIDATERQMTSLTVEQYALLDAVDEAPRVLCSGGAGTGKTFLAAEAARREAGLGRRVLFVCRSPVLASFLRSRLPAAVVVKTVLELDRISLDAIPAETLIVDEAQDLLTFEILDKLESTLVGGVEHGRWRVFLDPNNQAGIYGQFDPDAFLWLKNCGGIPLRLHRNCRNTEPIVLQAQLATGADIGTALIEGGGPPVEFFTARDKVHESEALAARIAAWQNEGVELSGITVLSLVCYSESAAALLPNSLRRNMVFVSPETSSRWPCSALSFATIEQFKGLENHCIALVDLEDYDGSTKAESELYVAMTRAHSGLWISASARARTALDGIRTKNSLRLAAKG